MKPKLFVLLLASLLLTGCARFGGRKTAAPAPTSAPAPTVAAATQEATAQDAPDLAAMTFVEKNNLYLRLLDEAHAAGRDTGAAEESYLQSMQASLEGDNAGADKALDEAILLLWNK